MRLFIALNFNDTIVDTLTDLQDELRSCGATGNYTPRENLHLTLAFIGEYGNPDEVLDVMREVPFRPVTIQYEGLQHYRDLYFARLKSNPGLDSYVSRLRRALAEQDIPYDRKKFAPHITLIRKVSFINGTQDDIPDDSGLQEVTADRVSLMLSERGRNGMIYTELGGIWIGKYIKGFRQKYEEPIRRRYR